LVKNTGVGAQNPLNAQGEGDRFAVSYRSAQAWSGRVTPGGTDVCAARLAVATMAVIFSRDATGHSVGHASGHGVAAGQAIEDAPDGWHSIPIGLTQRADRAPFLTGSERREALHRTMLCNSIYQGDDQLLVNTHVYGTPAANAPVLHLRKVAGGNMVATYLASFERVWAQARPVES